MTATAGARRRPLDLRPHRLGGQRPVILLPAPLVADQRGRLEGEHPEPHLPAVADHPGELAEIAWCDGHGVGQVVAHAVLALQPLEQLAEAPPVGVQLTLAAGPRDTAAPVHQRVEVARERQPRKARPPVGAERQSPQVLPVEVAVRHAHRLAPVPAHRLQRGGVVVGVEQADLAADQLRERPGAAAGAQVGHLPVDLGDGVGAVHADPVGVTGVVAGAAGKVAAREHAVSALTAQPAPAQQLRRVLDVAGQLLPAAPQGGQHLRLRRTGRLLHPAQALQERADHPASSLLGGRRDRCLVTVASGTRRSAAAAER
jgi:hypothetical protein